MTNKTPSQPSKLPEYYTALIEEVRKDSNIKTLKIKPAAQKLSRSVAGVWADVKVGVVPPPIKVSTRSIAFIEGELDALLAAKREMSRTHQPIDLRTFVSLLVAPRQASQA